MYSLDICSSLHGLLPKINKSRKVRAANSRGHLNLCDSKKVNKKMETYKDRPTWYAYPEEGERTALRDRHATISVIKHRMGKLDVVDEYLDDCEQRFKVEYLKRLNGTTPSRGKTQ